MAVVAERLSISQADYLAEELHATLRSEYVQGSVYVMAGASDGHVTVTGNCFVLLKQGLRGSGCKPYMNDMKVWVQAADAYFYPDVMVCCDPADSERNYVKEAPALIIEVLSGSTEAYDRGGKFALYRKLPSLLEYVLIDPRLLRVEVFRRNSAGRWELFSYEGVDTEVELHSLGLQWALADIYEDVNFALTQTDR